MVNGKQPQPPNTPRKVPSACQRCRRQKLKCDINRPCTLCARAGVECLPAATSQWRVYSHAQHSEADPPAKRARKTGPESNQIDSPKSGPTICCRIPSPYVLRPNSSLSAEHEHAGNTDQPAWNSSSTMSLVNGIFQLHNARTPRNQENNAIPGGDSQNIVSADPTEHHGDNVDNTSRRLFATQDHGTTSYLKLPSLLTDLQSLVPPYGAAELLVDTYFDRVHWFLLIFHQDDFRRNWPMAYCMDRSRIRKSAGTHDPAFLSVFLMVVAIGAKYAGPHRRRLLAKYGVDSEGLQEAILSTVKARWLDIIARNSLETVQTCILLGTYYLFHGAPRLAWPVCGCGLRVAQSLNLHRRPLIDAQTSSEDLFVNKQNETRKRCWWAIYEIETFCSMSYGYPHSIRDEDCNVEPLDPSAKLQVNQSPQNFSEPLRCETTLLSYKYYMSKLYVLTKTVLTELYGIGSPLSNNDRTSSEPRSRMRILTHRVSSLDSKLREWWAELPSKLRWDLLGADATYSSIEEFDHDIGASGPKFENHIYHLQALALKLAYENTLILIHRPLLSYRLVVKVPEDGIDTSNNHFASQTDPFRTSLQACREAAMSMSDLINSPILDLVSETYAAAFVSIHTFTAGVTLGILNSIEPLTTQAQEAKVGLHRLMSVQGRLKSRSILASQGLEILQRLTKLVMDKELKLMLDISSGGDVQPNGRSSGLNRDAARSTHQRGVTAPSPVFSAPFVGDQSTVAYPEKIQDIPSAAGILDPQSVECGQDLPYVEETELSEMLYDFDQALSTYASDSWLNAELSVDTSLHNRGFGDEELPMLEQTWIWGLDDLPFQGPNSSTGI